MRPRSPPRVAPRARRPRTQPASPRCNPGRPPAHAPSRSTTAEQHPARTAGLGPQPVVSARSHARAVRVRERAVSPTVLKSSREVQRSSFSHRCAGASPRCPPLLYSLGRGRSPRHPPSQRSLAVPLPRRAPPRGSPRRLVQAGLSPTPSALHASGPPLVESLRFPPGLRPRPAWVVPTVRVAPPPTAAARRAALPGWGAPTSRHRGGVALPMAPPSRGDLAGAAGTGVHLVVAPPRAHNTPPRPRSSRG